MIIKMKKQVMPNATAHYPLTNSKTSFPNPHQVTPQFIFWAWHSFGEIQSPVPAVLSSSFHCVPPHRQSIKHGKKSLN